MSTTATNVYRIENLNSYSAKYRLYRVRGLLSGDADFYRNLDALCTRLSRDLWTPATFLLRDEAFVVLRDDTPEPAQHFQLVRTTAVLERGSEVLTLDFGHLTAETRPIALRFLQFSLQGALWRRRDLWQPRTGGTFFEKEAAHLGETIGLHRGFLARVIDLGDGAFGICVDVRHKYVSKQPLPAVLNRKSFADRFKALHTIYHYGHEWFEIRLSDLNDLSVTEYQIVKDGKQRSLLEYIQIHSDKPLPPELFRSSIQARQKFAASIGVPFCLRLCAARRLRSSLSVTFVSCTSTVSASNLLGKRLRFPDDFSECQTLSSVVARSSR